jgi:uncharacterized protein
MIDPNNAIQAAIDVQTQFSAEKNQTCSNALSEYKVLFLHGAGKGQESEFISAVCTNLAKQGLECFTTDFEYMQTQKSLNKKRPPDRMPKLLPFTQQWVNDHTVFDSNADKKIILAGKSMGSRVASMLLSDYEEAKVDKVVAWFALGFPFFAPTQKDPEKSQKRVAHLKHVIKPGLIVQGTRDAFGKTEEQVHPCLADDTQLYWLDTGDHDFKPLKKTGRTQQDLIDEACDEVIKFILAL